MVKSGGVLERLARCTTLILDKTGTLTAGQPAVTAVVPAGSLPSAEILTLAASLDQVSGHVLAAAIVRAAAGRDGPLVLPGAVQEVPGQGIAGTVGGRPVRVGRASWAGFDRPTSMGQDGPHAGPVGRRVHRVRRGRRPASRRHRAPGPDPAGRPGDDPGHPPWRRHPDRAGHR
jgi:cation transport ATPase